MEPTPVSPSPSPFDVTPLLDATLEGQKPAAPPVVRSAVGDPQGYTSFVGAFSQDKKRVLVEAVGQVTRESDGWRIRNPLPPEASEFGRAAEEDGERIEAMAQDFVDTITHGPFNDVLKAAGKSVTVLDPPSMPPLCPTCGSVPVGHTVSASPAPPPRFRKSLCEYS